MQTFGTDPKKLVRSNAPETSIEAAERVDTTQMEQIVYDAIKAFPHGAIQDDILEKLDYLSLPYSTITARFAALIRKKFVIRTEERRKGRSGRTQSVLMAVPRDGKPDA